MTPPQETRERKDDLAITRPSDREILVTRSFAAPRALVWRALTEPEQVRRWLILASETCEMDVRPGGRWRFVQRAADGTRHTFAGTYREVRAPERLVTTHTYDRFPGLEWEETTTLEERGGRTVLTTRIHHRNKEHRDGHFHSGIEAGYRQTFAQLDAALQHHAPGRETMTPTQKAQSQTDDLRITLPSDKELRFTRTFRAPPRLVFEGMTKPEHIREWYGLRGTHLEVCELDPRPGGKWRYAFPRDENGLVHSFSGVVREVVPGKRIVFTEIYDPIPGSDHVVTSTFEDLGGGQTRLNCHIVYLTKEARDGHIQSGMEPGMRQTFERLDALLARLA